MHALIFNDCFIKECDYLYQILANLVRAALKFPKLDTKLSICKNLHGITRLYLLTDNIGTTVDVYGNMENLTVGDPYDIQCEVYTDKIVYSDIVNITWIGPNNDTIVTDSRTNITATNSTGHNHTSTLRFSYLSEDDEGLFTCHVTILSINNSESFEIEEILSKLAIFQKITCNSFTMHLQAHNAFKNFDGVNFDSLAS